MRREEREGVGCTFFAVLGVRSTGRGEYISLRFVTRELRRSADEGSGGRGDFRVDFAGFDLALDFLEVEGVWVWGERRDDSFDLRELAVLRA